MYLSELSMFPYKIVSISYKLLRIIRWRDLEVEVGLNVHGWKQLKMTCE